MHGRFTVQLIDVNTGTAARGEPTVSAVGLKLRVSFSAEHTSRRLD
jgi:hypothetical protein